MPGSCGLIGHIAGTLVQTGWGTWSNFARQAISETNEYLGQLDEVTLSSVPLDISFDIDSALSTPFQKPAAPTVPDLTYADPTAPGDIVIGDISLPVLDALNILPPSEPALSLPTAPDRLNKQAPNAVPELTEPDMPDSPVLIMPDAPSRLRLVIPEAPDLTLSTFDKDAPVANIAEPNDTFVFVEELYSSNLLDSVRDRISTMLAGGTGLPDPIWQAIWEKNTEREDKNGVKAVREATEEWASRGFSLPPGALAQRVGEVRQQVLEAKNTASREVAVQHAQMEIENIRFAVAQALALEDTLISAHLQRQARLLQAQQIAVEISVNLFNARVNLFNAQVTAFRADAEAYRTKLEGELKELEKYRLVLDGKRIQGELNRQEMEIYTAQLQALNTRVTLYRSQIEAATAIAEMDRLKLEAFKTRVEAFGEEVRAKTAEFQAYGEQIRGELAKVQVYDSTVRAYGSRIDAWKALSDGKIAQSRLSFDAEELKLKKFSSQLESYRTRVAGESSRVESLSKIYDAQSKMYVAELGAEGARVESEDKRFAVAAQAANNETQLELKKAELNIEQLRRIAELEQDQLKTIATVQSSLAAGAMSAVNLSAGVTESADNSTSCSTTYSF